MSSSPTPIERRGRKAKKEKARVVKGNRGTMARMLPFLAGTTEQDYLRSQKMQQYLLQWEFKPLQERSWKEFFNPEESKNEEEEELPSLIDEDCIQEGFLLERGTQVSFENTIEIGGTEEDVPYFREEFFEKKGYHLFVGEGEKLGPVCIAIQNSSTGHRSKALIRTKYVPSRHDRLWIPSNYTSPKDKLKYLKHRHYKLQNEHIKFHQVNDPQLANDLVEMEKQHITTKYKFGIVYMKEDQTEENEIYSNVEESEDFKEFLNFIGRKIKLQGWSAYSGGLDTKTNSTGEYSVYSKFDQYEIMFHVSTLLPYQDTDQQRVERKRHIGNDVVVIVFKEGNQPFSPSSITSQFNHVFAVVQPFKSKVPSTPSSSPASFSPADEEQTAYRIAFANKPGVVPYYPFLEKPAIYTKSDGFRQFLLTKLINAERGAMHSAQFKAKMMSVRRIQLETLIESYLKKKSGKRAKKFPSDLSNVLVNAQMEYEEALSLAEKLLPCADQPSTEFNTNYFNGLLKQLVPWSLLVSSDENSDLIPESVKQIIKWGQALSSLIERNKEHNEEEEALRGNLKKSIESLITSIQSIESRKET